MSHLVLESGFPAIVSASALGTFCQAPGRSSGGIHPNPSPTIFSVRSTYQLAPCNTQNWHHCNSVVAAQGSLLITETPWFPAQSSLVLKPDHGKSAQAHGHRSSPSLCVSVRAAPSLPSAHPALLSGCLFLVV